MHEFYSSKAFENAFTYSGTDLGACWTAEQTAFRLWAPIAESAWVKLYHSGDPDAGDFLEAIPMEADTCGTWVARKSGDLNGIYYTYLVSINGQKIEACDPYAKTTGVNGHRAMVLDMESTNPPGWEQDQDPHAGAPLTDAVLYELHIRDLSMHRSSRICNKGKFLGLTESGTRTKLGNKTGLDYIKELGITHLHLLPVFDYGSVNEADSAHQYNWGYDPVNFNVPEGSYSSDAFNGAIRVWEMKQMVKALHDNGISVVMDVVYNHVYHTEEFSINRLVPGYFSRAGRSGVLSNGSCCGNDTASERSMVKKYIVDSVKYWADEYHIDGFRFDLVGLIDTETINAVMEAVHKDHPNVIFYGEGWTMNTELTKPGYTLTVQSNSGMVPGFAFFNDTLRDLLRGSVFDNTTAGYISGAHCSKDELEACFMGVPMWAANPCQCVNYASCHDNNTLFDRVQLAAPEASRADQVRMNHLAAAFYMLSQGVPFLLAGEELLRSKALRGGKFEQNSYQSPDRVNAIKWEILDTQEGQKSLHYYQGLIAFRKAHSVLRLQTRSEIWNHIKPIALSNPHAVAFLVENEEESLFIAFNADLEAVSAPLPSGKWEIHIQNQVAGTAVLGEVSSEVSISPLSAIALVQKKPANPVDVVAALIWEKDKFMICQRPATKARGLLWEFAGGKVEKGETFSQALIRECREELDVTVDVGDIFMQVIHEYPDILIRLSLFHCTIPDGFPKALEHHDIRWIHPNQIDEYEFCPADEDILKAIKKQYAKKKPLS